MLIEVQDDPNIEQTPETIKRNALLGISVYCRFAINNNICDNCEICPINRAYEIISETKIEEEES